jgi:hypothetical protein
MANYLDATVGAVGGSAARPDRIMPGVMVDAARIKDGGAGLLLAKHRAGLPTQGVPGVATYRTPSHPVEDPLDPLQIEGNAVGNAPALVPGPLAPL